MVRVARRSGRSLTPEEADRIDREYRQLSREERAERYRRWNSQKVLDDARRLFDYLGHLTLDEMADETGMTADRVFWLCGRFKIPCAPGRYTKHDLRTMREEDIAVAERQRQVALARREAPTTPPYKPGPLVW